MKYSKNYVVCLQFLGFRFSGWQKQKNAKTLHEMVDKSLSYALGNDEFKTLGVGRTDAKVSANSYYFQLFMNTELIEDSFLSVFNENLSPDFRALSMKQVDASFNILNAAKQKEYHYYFSFGDKNHPYAAPFLTNIMDDLDIETMQKGANLFKGEHFFDKYCTKPSAKTILKRTIDSCEIVENTILKANFFPKKSYVLKVKGKGFLRYQIRLIMATLFELGKGNLTLEFIEDSLKEDNDKKYLRNIAPASGLQLYNVELDI